MMIHAMMIHAMMIHAMMIHMGTIRAGNPSRLDSTCRIRLISSSLPKTLKPLAQRLALTPKAVRTLYGELGRMRDSALQVGAIPRAPDAPVVVLVRGPRRDGGSLRAARLDGTWLDLQRNLARSMKNGTLQVVPGSGHYIHLDRPERVVAAIRAMVDAFRLGREPGGSR